METFTKLFGSLLLFVYHCFDRVVIHGYLSGLSRPGQVVIPAGSGRAGNRQGSSLAADP
jgi:hypothetical protein